MSVASSLFVTFSPFFAAVTLTFGAMKYADDKRAPLNHWALQRRLEADKAFPTQNKWLDFTMCLAHGT